MTIAAQTLGGTRRFCYVLNRIAGRVGVGSAGRDPDQNGLEGTEWLMTNDSTIAPTRKPTPKKPDDWTPLGDVAAAILRGLVRGEAPAK